MPFRSKALLETWLAEYAGSKPGSHLARVAVQDEDTGSDGGLVVLPLRAATTSVYMQPAVLGSPEWRVTFESRADVMVASSADVRALADELSAAADLADFLEEKSRLHLDAMNAED
jgi:hypothetical protein